MNDEIITLSSSDEDDIPVKKIKLSSQVTIRPVIREEAVAKIANQVKEKKSWEQHSTNNVSVITNSKSTLLTQSKENGNVVTIIDESFEETVTKKSLQEECLIVPSDSEDELKPAEVPKVTNCEILDRPSTSKASDAHKILDQLLETCEKSLTGSKYESKILPYFSKVKLKFEECQQFHDEPHFQKMLRDYIEMARHSAGDAVVSFQRIFSYLKDHIEGESVEVEESDVPKLRKLSKTCKLLMKKIKKLERMEINFDDEEDSTYIQIDKFTQKLNKVYAKYCQLLKRNPHAGRLLYERVQYVSSKHLEINRAVTKALKSTKFPSYYEIEKCIRNCVKKHDLNLNEDQIREESKMCFTKVGNMLQMRRKKELYEVHCSFLETNEDPASNNEDLKKQLQENFEEGENKMKEVVAKYVKLEEDNVKVELSADSDDSNIKDSESGEEK